LIRFLKKIDYSHPVYILSIYIFFHILIRLLLSDTLQVDDREQVILANKLSLGYAMPQPPLYTWVLWVLFQIFGSSLFILTIFKYFLLFGSYVFIWKISNKIYKDSDLKELCFYSYLMMPSFFWHIHQGFTHTALLGFAITFTLYYFLKTKESPSLINFFILGTAISIGFLSKYSYILFFVPLFLAGFILKEYRDIYIYNKKALIALVPILVIVTPHLLWLIDNFNEIYSQANSKLEITKIEGNPLVNIYTLIISSIGFITPLFFFYIYFFIKRNRAANTEILCQERKLFNNFFIVIIFSILLFFTFFNIPQVKVRWLHPILMVLPFWFFAFFAFTPNGLEKGKKIFFSFLIFLSILIVLIRVTQTTIGPNLGIYGRLNVPVTETLRKIPLDILEESSILFKDYTIAAHGILLFKSNVNFFKGEKYNTKNNKIEKNCIIIDSKPFSSNGKSSISLNSNKGGFKYTIYYSYISRQCSDYFLT